MPADQDIKAGHRRVILHCGVQETASTSLHRFLRRNRSALSQWADVHGPTPQQTLVRDMGHLAMQFSLDPSTELENRLVETLRALRDKLMTGTSAVLLSHENLFGAMIGKGGVVTLYPDLERIVKLINTNLAPLKPEFVYYTREMISWKQSVYGQAVISDHYSQSRDVFLEKTANCGSWDGMHSRLVTLLGEARVQRYRLEGETDDTRPGTQLLQYAGLSDDGIAGLVPMAGRSNQGQKAGRLNSSGLSTGWAWGGDLMPRLPILSPRIRHCLRQGVRNLLTCYALLARSRFLPLTPEASIAQEAT